MKPRARRAALAAWLLTAALSAAGCGGDAASTQTSRPAHRPISIVYVTGNVGGPWGHRTEGLIDGVKLAVAERDGLIGERAVSVAAVPTQQRDGNTVSAAIGAGRILRDSRTLAVLATYSAPQLAIAAPQLNGGELSLLQFGSGMMGLTEPEQPGEPGRYEPSGVRYAIRGVAGDGQVAAQLATRSELRGAQVVAVTGAYQERLRQKARDRAKLAAAARKKALKNGAAEVPGTDPALTNPSPEVPDASRLAAQIAKRVGGTVVEASSAEVPGRSGATAGRTPRIVVTDSTEPSPSTAARTALRGASGAVAVVDAADRPIDPSVTAGASPAFTVERLLADPTSASARKIRARERAQFGRDRRDAVVAGYRAAVRLLDLAAAQPGRTIDRVAYAKALTAPAPSDPNFPVDAAGQSLLASATLQQRVRSGWQTPR